MKFIHPHEIDRRFWLTPSNIYSKLDAEFGFDFDRCPYPRPDDYNSLDVEWGHVSYVNPPFRKKDTPDGRGPTAFVRKAIAENKKGKTVVMMIPTQSYVNLLIEAGAELRSAGRVRWLSGVEGEPTNSPSPITCFVLRP
jgi:DNA N-6-adenine-methyltransferase (Dam)